MEPAPTGNGYSVGEWRGMPRYQCDSCPYDSLGEQEVIDHVARQHGPNLRARRTQILTADRHGRETETVVIEETTPQADAEPASDQ